jgi:hypothetical protein
MRLFKRCTDVAESSGMKRHMDGSARLAAPLLPLRDEAPCFMME